MSSRRTWWSSLVGVTLLLSSFLLYHRWQLDAVTSPDVAVIPSTPSNPFQLSPEAHARRPPTTQTLRWRITRNERRPDGVLKHVYLINDQFPGPTIETRPGDRLIIHVENALPEDSVSIHWHGLAMRGYNDMDGAVGVTQDGITPGQSLIYDFKLADDQQGTFWYHAHSSVQRADGLYGGLIIHSPMQSHQSNEHLLMIGDWYHRTADELLGWYLNADSFGMEPVPDSLLINGEGRYNCENAVPARPLDCKPSSMLLSSLDIDTSRPVKLRIINVGAFAAFSLAVDGAEVQATAVDGGNPVSSQAAHGIGTLYPGERTDLLVSCWPGLPSLEVTLLSERWKYTNPALEEVQRFTMKSSQHKGHTDSIAFDGTDLLELDTLSSLASYPGPEDTADTTVLLYTMTEKLAHLDYIPTGNINRTIWHVPTPALISTTPDAWSDDQFVVHIPYHEKKPSWVDVVINNLDEDDHPFHLHGHDFYIMQTYSSDMGWGSWNPYEDATPPGGLYAERPLKKDTVMIPRRGYAVLRFLADNPGIWMFHCHIIWHLAGGMAMAFDVS